MTEIIRKHTPETATNHRKVMKMGELIITKAFQAMPDLDFALEMSSAIECIVQSTEDHMDAERAIMEKRPPIVRGR